MKKNIIAFFSFLIILNITKAQNRIVVDSIRYVIGSSLKLSTEYVQVYKSGNVNVRINILKGDESEVTLTPNNYRIIYEKDGVLGVTGLPKRRAILKIDYDLGFDIIDSSAYYLKVIANVPFSLDGGTEVYNSYWVIKPKYPALTPVYKKTYIPLEEGILNFSALGLDNDTLYSYKIFNEENKEIDSGKGPIVSLDKLTKNTELYNKKTIIRGLYNKSTFQYKSYNNKDSIYRSQWTIKINVPNPDIYLKSNWEWIEVENKYLICLNFWYDIEGKKILPKITNIRGLNDFSIKLIREGTPITRPDENQKKEGIQFNVSDLEQIEGKSLDIKFDDQFTPDIKRSFTLTKPKKK